MVEIYTDGSCFGNPGPGGYAAIVSCQTKNGTYQKTVSGGEALTTNNRMEMTALLKALEIIKKPCEITIYADSQYLIDGYRRLPMWIAKGWRTSQGEVKNRDLWEAIKNTIEQKGLAIQFSKVLGHSGVEKNELCDQLAKKEASKYA